MVSQIVISFVCNFPSPGTLLFLAGTQYFQFCKKYKKNTKMEWMAGLFIAKSFPNQQF